VSPLRGKAKANLYIAEARGDRGQRRRERETNEQNYLTRTNCPLLLWFIGAMLSLLLAPLASSTRKLITKRDSREPFDIGPSDQRTRGVARFGGAAASADSGAQIFFWNVLSAAAKSAFRLSEPNLWKSTFSWRFVRVDAQLLDQSD